MIQKELLRLKPDKVLVTDEEGKKVGVLSFDEAIKLAEEQNKDLFLITDKAPVVVVRIGDYKKYLYLKEKKKKEVKKPKEMKTVRIGVNEAQADLERKAKMIEKFLSEGYPVEVRMFIKGRQQIHHDFVKERFQKFLDMIQNKKLTQPIKDTQNLIIAYLAKL